VDGEKRKTKMRMTMGRKRRGKRMTSRKPEVERRREGVGRQDAIRIKEKKTQKEAMNGAN
jgi:hypothetical protein